MLLCGVASCAIIAFSSPAAAQVNFDGTVALPANPNPTIGTSNLVTGNTVINPASPQTLDGQGGPGFFVTQGSSLTINNTTLQNFITTGGSGSGGGLGAGGAIFIDNGGTVFLNNTSFLHNTVIGGTGGTNSPYGGTLNGITTVAALGTNPNGLNGRNGAAVPNDNPFTFGDGNGNGVSGCCHTNGLNAVNGFGGLGGNGGPGSNGWGSNPVAALNVAVASQNLVVSALSIAGFTLMVADDLVTAAADAPAAINTFEDPLAAIDAAYNTVGVIGQTLNLTANILNLASNIQALYLAAGAQAAWNDRFNAGYVGNGGSGETGGNGGNGSYGFGGGGGGQGGAYGLASSSGQYALDGVGGSGGNGGNGGFGAGGGAGGFAYGAGQNGNGAAGATSQNGTPGSGGAAGWGGGVGSMGGVTGGAASCLGGISGSTPGIACGGGGGFAFGGAIFVNTGALLVITGNATFEGNSAIGGVSLNNGQGGGSTGADLFIMPGGRVILPPGAGNVITFNDSIADASTASNEIPEAFPPLSTAVGQGGGVTIYAGTTIFNGWDTYSGQTVINGGALGGPLNPGTNRSGTPDYNLTDGALQIGAQGLPINSNLNFSGPGQFTGGVLQVSTGGTWSREVNPNPNPNGGGNTGSSPASSVQWTGSGGFAAIGGPVTITLNTGGALDTGNGGPLVWGQNGFVPFGYSLIFGSATSTDMVTFTNSINLGDGSKGTASILVANNLDPNNPGGSMATMSGVLSGNGGGLNINGGGFNGTLILAGVNTYTGATVVNSGTLALSGSGSIANSSSLTIGVAAGFDISQTTSGATITTLTGSGNVLLGAQTLTVTNGGTFSGTIADGGIACMPPATANCSGGGLTVAGGTLALSGANTYTGITTINANATLALVGAGSIAGTSNVLDNGTFDITQTSIGAMIGSLSGSGTASIGSKLLVITNASTTFSGNINDSGLGGSLIIAGGTQTFSGVNTYTGATFVNTGATLALSGSGSIVTSDIVDVLGTFDISQTSAGASITTLAGTGNVALGSRKLTITAGATNFAGAITDGGIGGGTGGKLEISGGTHTLSGTNTYTGSTTIDAAPTPIPGPPPSMPAQRWR
jgi:autotransporter-associated beta strand protein